MKQGDEVYIRAVVTLAPEGDRTLFRCETAEEHMVIWAVPSEVVPQKGEKVWE